MVYLVPGGVLSPVGVLSPEACTWFWGMSGSKGCLLWGVSALGVSAPRRVSALGGVCSWGGCLLLGVVSQHALRQTPPVNRMTDRCKNIALATTSLWPVTKKML